MTLKTGECIMVERISTLVKQVETALKVVKKNNSLSRESDYLISQALNDCESINKNLKQSQSIVNTLLEAKNWGN